MTDTMRVVPNYPRDKQELLIRELVASLAALTACGWHHQIPSTGELNAAMTVLKKASTL